MSSNHVIGGRYLIEREIGAGGLGTVFLGLDQQNQQAVAIKELRGDQLIRDPSVVDRFEREAAALARLNHPNIVKILDTIREERRYFLVMEYVGGGSLADILQREGRLTVAQALHIALDLSDALTRAHRQSIIHRDIKPGNVLIAEDGTPRLADFNVAYISDLSAITMVGARIGTYVYMSPEALRGDPPNQRTDIWAFGVTLFEMLTGQRPFKGETPSQIEQAILNQPHPNIRRDRADIPPALRSLIDEMLEKNPQRRIRSMRQVSARIEEIQDVLQAHGPEDDPQNQPTLFAPGSNLPDPNRTISPKEPTASTDPVVLKEPTTIGRPALALDLIVTENAPGRFAVSAATDSQTDLIGPFPIEPMFDHTKLPTAAEKSMTGWVNLFSEAHQINASQGVKQAEEIGHLLFELLFQHQAIRKRFRQSYAHVQQRKAENAGPLRLRLNLPPSLTVLPWELIFDREHHTSLAHDPLVTLARTVGSASQNMLSPVEEELRIVVVLARPDKAAPIDGYDQVKPLESAVAKLQQRGVPVKLEKIDGHGTWQQLHDRLNKTDPVHILHIISHGMFDEGDLGEGQLAFESQQGTRHNVSASLLRDLLNTHKHLVRLVFLVACQSGMAERGNPFSSIAETLARGGIPAVLAMQFNVLQDVARHMTESFYEQIAMRQPIDSALTTARLNLRSSEPDHLAWAVPVLFLHNGGEVILGERTIRQPEPHGGLTVMVDANAPPAAPANTRDNLTMVFPERDRPLIPKNNPDLREAELASFSRDWRRAVWIYKALEARFRLPPDHHRKLTEAERELEQLDLLEEIDKYESQENWPEVIAHLERYCQRYTEDTVTPRRLERARAEQEIIELGLELAQLAESLEWAKVISHLDTLEQKRQGYTESRRDLKQLRREALSELAYERASEAMNAHEWDKALIEIDRLPGDYLTDQLRRLKKLAQNEIYQELLRQRAETIGRIRGSINQERFADALAAIIAEQRNPELRQDLQPLLAELIETPKATLDQRFQSAEQAQLLGDTRAGVCNLPLRMIPLAGGSFQIGSTADEIKHANELHQREQQGLPHPQPPREWSNDERNAQPINVPSFALSRYPVTNGLFQLFMDEQGYDPDQPWWQGYSRTWLIQKAVDRPAYWNDARLGRHRANHPVVGVSWFEAQAFCAWLTQHPAHNTEQALYRLPTELEWEFAARGASRRLYPWGYKEPDRSRANFATQFGATTPVGCFVDGHTPEGVADMAGNVWEWTGSTYGPYPPLLSNNYLTLKGEDGPEMVVRGGGWTSQKTLLRAAHRFHYPPAEMKRFLGFRVAREAPTPAGGRG